MNLQMLIVSLDLIGAVVTLWLIDEALLRTALAHATIKIAR
jgi:hypothetical protein